MREMAMQLYLMQPDFNRDGNLPWHWVEHALPWSINRDDAMIKPGRKARKWKPFTVDIVRRLDRDDPSYCRMRQGDFYYFQSGYPVVNPRAWLVLEPVIGPVVEVLPLKTKNPNDPPLLLINVLDRVRLAKDAEVTWNEIARAATSVRRYSFHDRDVGDKVIFRVDGLAFSDCLVSAAVVKAVQKAKLRGVAFRQLKDCRSRRRGYLPTRIP